MEISMKNIVVFVKDQEIARKFYVDQLGLPLGQKSQMMMEFFPGSGTQFGVSVALTEEAMKLVGRHTGITFRVPEIVDFCKKLSAEGVSFAEPLEVSPWGKMAVVSDPDGNLFALVDR